ncbi:uncharacterized protein LAESUDRAFT_655880 [Laetiporus sulphureus 93-53]|uniref:Peptidase C14 caspase domain-containing protein n=1 Tax=Laetiporus sulphureus 93-53 TaxID=1314785 RepID=A0A165DR06_9APHY|nr:uncharacterized protein LAESUDRAFT_655880 [Laetiporus sulphureus 93-53]KZT05440.1 hypothetical protein LAESUDRAFT_655880 [Laetiporus sulphureus 93-53]
MLLGCITHTKSCSDCRTFALVVAIDKYASVRSLKGCKNDARGIVDYMQNKLAARKSDIHTFYDENASRENILSAFRTQLIDNEEIKSGDLMIFYFAGHDTSQYAPKEWEVQPKGEIERICPQDIDFKSVHGIPSFTLNALLTELADKKGNNSLSERMSIVLLVVTMSTGCHD